MFYSEWLFLKFKKKSAFRQFGFINQSVRDVREIAGCRVKGWGVERNKRQEYFSGCRGKTAVSVCMWIWEKSGYAKASSMAAVQSQCVCIYIYISTLAAAINLFFASSEIPQQSGESLASRVESSERCFWLCIHAGAPTKKEPRVTSERFSDHVLQLCTTEQR